MDTSNEKRGSIEFALKYIQHENLNLTIEIESQVSPSTNPVSCVLGAARRILPIPTNLLNRSTDNTSEILRKNWILSISVTPCLLNQD